MPDLARLDLQIRSQGVDQANQRLDRFSREGERAERATRQLERSFSRGGRIARLFGNEIGSIARLLGPLLTSFLAFQGVSSAVDSIRAFEDAQSQLQGVAIQTTDTLASQQRQMVALAEEAKRLGSTTRFTAGEASEAQLFLARTGFEVRDIIAALPGTLDLAQAAVLGLGEAADIASNTLKQFNLDAAEMGRVGDTLISVANTTNTDVRQLAEALKLAGPIAAALGHDLESTSAALGVLGDAGLQASLAGTQLRGILAALSAPTSEARGELEKLAARLGATPEEVFNPAVNSLSEIFENLRRVRPEAEEFFRIFSRRQTAGALVLTEFANRIGEVEARSREAQGESARLAEIMRDTLTGSVKSLQSAFEGLTISVGEGGLSSALRGVLDTTTAVLRQLTGTEGVIRGLNAQLEEGIISNVQYAEAVREIQAQAQATGAGVHVLTAGFESLVALGLGRVLVGLASGFGTLAAQMAQTATTTTVTTVTMDAYTGATTRATVATGGLFAVLRAHPIGLLLTALSGAVFAWSLFRQETEQARDELQGFDEEIGAVIDRLERIGRIDVQIERSLRLRDFEAAATQIQRRIRELNELQVDIETTKPTTDNLEFIERASERLGREVVIPIRVDEQEVLAEITRVEDQLEQLELRRAVEFQRAAVSGQGRAAPQLQRVDVEIADVEDQLRTLEGRLGEIRNNVQREFRTGLADVVDQELQRFQELLDDTRARANEETLRTEREEGAQTFIRELVRQRELVEATTESERRRVEILQQAADFAEEKKIEGDELERFNRLVERQIELTERSVQIQSRRDEIAEQRQEARDSIASFQDTLEEEITTLRLESQLFDKNTQSVESYKNVLEAIQLTAESGLSLIDQEVISLFRLIRTRDEAKRSVEELNEARQVQRGFEQLDREFELLVRSREIIERNKDAALNLADAQAIAANSLNLLSSAQAAGIPNAEELVRLYEDASVALNELHRSLEEAERLIGQLNATMKKLSADISRAFVPDSALPFVEALRGIQAQAQSLRQNLFSQFDQGLISSEQLDADLAEIDNFVSVAADRLGQLQTLEQIRGVASDISSEFGRAFQDIITGAEGAEEAGRRFVEAVNTALLERLVIQPVVDQLTSALTNVGASIAGISQEVPEQAALQVGAQTAASAIEKAGIAAGGAMAAGGTAAAEAIATATVALVQAIAAAKAATLPGGAPGSARGNVIALGVDGFVSAPGIQPTTDPVRFFARGGLPGDSITNIQRITSSEVRVLRDSGAASMHQFGRAGDSGIIVDQPTLFSTREGFGVAGESGEEIILPARRTPEGRLGIEAIGASSSEPRQRIEQNTYTVNQRIVTQDANSFRRSRRMVVDDARRGFRR